MKRKKNRKTSRVKKQVLHKVSHTHANLIVGFLVSVVLFVTLFNLEPGITGRVVQEATSFIELTGARCDYVNYNFTVCIDVKWDGIENYSAKGYISGTTPLTQINKTYEKQFTYCQETNKEGYKAIHAYLYNENDVVVVRDNQKTIKCEVNLSVNETYPKENLTNETLLNITEFNLTNLSENITVNVTEIIEKVTNISKETRMILHKFNHTQRQEKESIPEGWYYTNTIDIHETDEQKWDNKTAYIEYNEFCREKALIYDLNRIIETGDNKAIKSNRIKISKGDFKLVFYTKADVQLIGKQENAFYLEFKAVDPEGDEIGGNGWSIVWNNESVWNYNPLDQIQISFEEDNGWKMVSVNFSITDERVSDAILAFSSDGINDYTGKVAVCRLEIEEVK